MSIKELREQTGLSQSQFATKYHMSVRTLQNWEQGKVKTPEYVLFLLEKDIKRQQFLSMDILDERTRINKQIGAKS